MIVSSDKIYNNYYSNINRPVKNTVKKSSNNNHKTGPILIRQNYHMKKDTNLSKKANFVGTIKAASVPKTNETKKLSKAEEMVEFKKEIYIELEEISSMNSPKVLSDSIQITEDRFERMKEDHKYRKK